MARVRCDGWQWTFFPVERERKCAELLEPESIDDLSAKTFGFDAKADRGVGVPGAIEQLGGSNLRVVDVPLDFDERDGRLRQSAVGKRNAITRVLPALVDQAARRGARVLDQTISVDVTVAIDPLKGATCVREELVHEIEVAGPAPRLVEEDEPQRCRVDCSVVGHVRDLAAAGELTAAKLVHDPAGLLLRV